MFTVNESGEIVYRVTEDKTVVSHGQVACWWERISITAGDYAVTFNTVNFRPTTNLETAYWALVTIPGTIVENYYPALFGGVVMTSYDRTKDAGKPINYHIQTYGYSVRDAIT